MGLGLVLKELLGDDPPVGVRVYDGTRLGSDDAKATVVIHSPDALRRIVTRPGEELDGAVAHPVRLVAAGRRPPAVLHEDRAGVLSASAGYRVPPGEAGLGDLTGHRTRGGDGHAGAVPAPSIRHVKAARPRERPTAP